MVQGGGGMGKIGFQELAVIFLIAILLFGAAKLPQLGKAVGDTIKEFKKSMRDDETQGDKKA
jgi:sec-independent protein translocase protein TatA